MSDRTERDLEVADAQARFHETLNPTELIEMGVFAPNPTVQEVRTTDMPRKRPRRNYSEAVRGRFGSEGLHMRLEEDMTDREQRVAAAWRDYAATGDRSLGFRARLSPLPQGSLWGPRCIAEGSRCK